jgi:hypothetical protein
MRTSDVFKIGALFFVVAFLMLVAGNLAYVFVENFLATPEPVPKATTRSSRTPAPSDTPSPVPTCPTILYKMLPDGEGTEDELVLAYEYAVRVNRFLGHWLDKYPDDPDVRSATTYNQNALFYINEAHNEVVSWIQLGSLTCPAN